MKILSSSGEMGWKSKALTAFVLGANLLNYGCSSTINEQVPEKTMEQHFKEMQEHRLNEAMSGIEFELSDKDSVNREVGITAKFQEITSSVDSLVDSKNGDLVELGDKQVLVLRASGLGKDVDLEKLIDTAGQSIGEVGLSSFEIEELLKEKTNGYFQSAVFDTDNENIKIMTISNEQMENFLKKDSLDIFNGDQVAVTSAIIAHEVGHMVFEGEASSENEFFADIFSMKYMVEKGYDSKNVFDYYRNLRLNENGEHFSNHNNPFQYYVLEKMIEEDSSILKDMNVSQLVSASYMARDYGVETMTKSISGDNYKKLSEIYMGRNGDINIDIHNLKNTLAMNISVKINSGEELKISDLESFFEGINAKEVIPDEMKLFMDKVKENHCNDDGTLKKSIIGYISNDFYKDLIKSDIESNYLRDKLNDALMIDAMKMDNSLSKKLKESGDVIAKDIVNTYRMSESVNVSYDKTMRLSNK